MQSNEPPSLRKHEQHILTKREWNKEIDRKGRGLEILWVSLTLSFLSSRAASLHMGCQTSEPTDTETHDSSSVTIVYCVWATAIQFYGILWGTNQPLSSASTSINHAHTNTERRIYGFGGSLSSLWTEPVALYRFLCTNEQSENPL